MFMTDEKVAGVDRSSTAELAAELAASGALDGLFAKIDGGEVRLTGEGGLVPSLVKATLERGLQVAVFGSSWL